MKKTNFQTNEGGYYWQDILHEIYKSIPYKYGPGKLKEDSDSLAKHLKIKNNELNRTIHYLIDNGLVRSEESDGFSFLYLTEMGFDIAIQNEKIKSEQKLQKIILMFTSIIAVATLYSFYASLDIFNFKIAQYALVGGASLIIFLIAIKLFTSKLSQK